MSINIVMIISELYIPNIVIAPHVAEHTSVIVTDPLPHLAKVGLSVLKSDRTLSALAAMIAVGEQLPIHKDLTNTDDQVEWSIILGGCGLVLEIYEDSSTYSTGTECVLAPSGTHSVPMLARDNAILVETITLGKSPVMFNPYMHWHSLRNPTDANIYCISIRSRSTGAERFLEKFKKK